MTESLRQQVIDEQYVAYQKGARSWLGIVPIVIFAIALPFAAATPWGAEYLGFSPLIYGVSTSVFVLSVVAATWGHRRIGSLSRKALLLEALETIGSGQLCVLIVLGPGSVLHVGWLAMAIYGLLAVPIAPKTSAPLRIYLGTLVTVVIAFAVRDGWLSGLGAAVIAIGGVIPMHPLLGYQTQSIDAEISRRELQQKLAAMEVEIDRQRISRGLHDGLSGQLTATLWLLRGAKSRLPEDIAQTLEHHLQRCLVELRSAVWNVDDAPIEVGALAARISRIPELLGDERVHVQCDIPHDHSTVTAQRASLLLAASLELTFNALRETSTRVDLRLHGVSLLIVEDDGPGLPTRLPKDGGIVSIQKRLENAGGELQIESQPGKTTMCIVFS